jgi:uncharacterized protein YjbI with pentapeptide repeats
MRFADLSHALLRRADFTNADLSGANLHRILEEKTVWDGAHRDGVRETDPERAAAEDWRPPEPEPP